MVELTHYHDLLILRATEAPNKKNDPLRRFLALMNVLTLGRNIKWRSSIRVATGAVISKVFLTPIAFYQDLGDAIYAIGDPQTILVLAKTMGVNKILFPRIYPYTEVREPISQKEFINRYTGRVTGVLLVSTETLEKELHRLLRGMKKRALVVIDSKKLLNKIISIE